uniref:Uncharacterized protein n=1 Tax=Pithovirus LCPAC201 TaxID=2506591 RepID=A0A481Z5L5_9VIRU|nr:MAG: hypothetical protein LCPAC201_01770 [Pithovirus LCPAC201]
MSSILDREHPRAVIVSEDITPIWVLIIISVIIILVFWIWIIYIIRTHPDLGTPMIECSPGQCSTDIKTGTKDCPTDPSIIKTIDPATQVCNSPFTCESNRTPFALQSDGSTNNNGVCESQVECKCLTQPQCAYYISAYFNTRNGNPFRGVSSQRIVFEQSAAGTDNEGNFINQSPYSFPSVTTQFCEIPNEWLGRTWPPVGSPTKLEKCIVGTMAYLPNNPDKFSQQDINITPLGCVQGNPCTGEMEVAFWNNKTYLVNCLVLTDSAD